MSIFTEKREKHGISCIFIIAVLLGLFVLALAIPASAQGTEVFVTLDQISQTVDFTVNEDITIKLTGNITITSESAIPVTVWTGIDAPSGWETSISPEELTVPIGTTIMPFEGEMRTVERPSGDYELKEFDVRVWASADSRDFGQIDFSSPASDHDTFLLGVIINRVKLMAGILEHRVLPESTITHTFTVTNVATVADTFFINIVNDERWKDQGWTISQSDDELNLEPGENTTFYVEQQIPSDAPEGDYDIDVWVSSKGDDTSTSSRTLITKVRMPKISEPFLTLGLILMVAFIGTGIGLVAFFAATEYGYLALLSLFLPLYVRLKKKDVLSHFTRGQIYGYIQANPGAHYNAIIQDLGLRNGVGAYHLKVLEREGFIKSMKDGIYKRFYPSNMRIPEKRLHLSRVQKDILDTIQKHPGVTQKQVSKLLDESKQVVNYNVKVLETAGLIRVEKVGRETACFAGNVRYVPAEDVYELVEDKGTPAMQV